MRRAALFRIVVSVFAAALLAAPLSFAAGIILTSDQQLRDLQDPDKRIDLSTGYTPVFKSLREVCEEGRKNGDKTLTVAFDEFFRQYRPQAGTDRKLTPDMDEYVEMIGVVGDFAKKYGMGLCLSLMSPLELGPAFKNYTGGESGRWLSYEVGFRNPKSGVFSLDIWQQLEWTNNKGRIHIQKKGVKAYAESLYGHEFRTGAHSSWAQSPTIDHWDVEKLHENAYKYEYTPNYVWGNTVHQASAACYDYFKWGEYLEPTGNDFAESGWGDRDYYGAAMGASLGVINRFPNAYAAAWGFPDEALRWKNTINEAYGASPGAQMSLLTDGVHRDVEVLMIYPMNLVAVEERFGSWMTLYGYANYLTSEKLVQMGSVNPDGTIQVAAKKYGTIAVMFEPLLSKGLLELLADFASKGGKVLWFSAPPLLDGEGKDCGDQWKSLFGTHRKTGNGDAYFFGFRPRDDQSASLGYETRTLYEILEAVGAYPSSGKFKVNDNPVSVSRNTEFFASKFPNGTTALVKHYRRHRESWDGGFSRDKARDDAALAVNPLPSDTLDIKGLKVNGHDVTYSGKRNVAFNTGPDGRLSAFNGNESSRITLDGTEYILADRPVSMCFGPVGGDFSQYRVYVDRESEVSVPMPAGAARVIVKQGKNKVKASFSDGSLSLDITGSLAGKWLDVKIY